MDRSEHPKPQRTLRNPRNQCEPEMLISSARYDSFSGGNGLPSKTHALHCAMAVPGEIPSFTPSIS